MYDYDSDFDYGSGSDDDEDFSDSDVISPAAPTLLGLPRELFQMITDELSRADGISLSLCSRYLYFYRDLRNHRYLAILDAIEKVEWDHGLWCLEDARPGEPGYTPFIMTSPRLDSNYPPFLTFDATLPEFDRYEATTETHSYLFIRMDPFNLMEDKFNLWLDIEYFDPPKDDASSKYESSYEKDYKTGREEEMDWEDVKGSLVRATRELMLQRITCPECKGTEGVTSGSSELAARWPELSRSKVKIRDLPCPRCQGYEKAVEVKTAIEKEAATCPFSRFRCYSVTKESFWYTWRDVD